MTFFFIFDFSILFPIVFLLFPLLWSLWTGQSPRARQVEVLEPDRSKSSSQKGRSPRARQVEVLEPRLDKLGDLGENWGNWGTLGKLGNNIGQKCNIGAK
jgi:hypothetical protein